AAAPDAKYSSVTKLKSVRLVPADGPAARLAYIGPGPVIGPWTTGTVVSACAWAAGLPAAKEPIRMRSATTTVARNGKRAGRCRRNSLLIGPLSTPIPLRYCIVTLQGRTLSTAVRRNL